MCNLFFELEKYSYFKGFLDDKYPEHMVVAAFLKLQDFKRGYLYDIDGALFGIKKVEDPEVRLTLSLEMLRIIMDHNLNSEGYPNDEYVKIRELQAQVEAVLEQIESDMALVENPKEWYVATMNILNDNCLQDIGVEYYETTKEIFPVYDEVLEDTKAGYVFGFDLDEGFGEFKEVNYMKVPINYQEKLLGIEINYELFIELS